MQQVQAYIELVKFKKNDSIFQDKIQSGKPQNLKTDGLEEYLKKVAV